MRASVRPCWSTLAQRSTERPNGTDRGRGPPRPSIYNSIAFDKSAEIGSRDKWCDGPEDRQGSAIDKPKYINHSLRSRGLDALFLAVDVIEAGNAKARRLGTMLLLRRWAAKT
jgi:hypothetical protein